LGAWAYLPVKVTPFLANCSVTLCHKQGCSANKNGVGTHPKKLAILKQLRNQNVEKVKAKHEKSVGTPCPEDLHIN